MFSDYFSSQRNPLTLGSGEKLVKFDQSIPINEKIKYIGKKLKKIDADDNFYYSLNHSKYFDKDNVPYCYYMSSSELKEIKKAWLDTNTSQILSGIEKSNPELKSKLNVIDNLSRQEKKKIDINGIGDIYFCLDDTMQLNESYRALLVISKEIKNEYIQTLLRQEYPDGIPKTTKDSMLLSKRIFASLLPALADQFTIRRTDLDTIKTIDLAHKDYISWEWIITPLKTGESKLILKLSRVETPLGDLDKFFPSKIITVHVAAIEKTLGQRIGIFWKEEWKWVITSILALIGWILAYRLKRKEIKTKSKPGERN
jgi:hypothetical protein